jgi:hypothetical protein
MHRGLIVPEKQMINPLGVLIIGQNASFSAE